jgi:hypothetical protein
MALVVLLPAPFANSSTQPKNEQQANELKNRKMQRTKKPTKTTSKLEDLIPNFTQMEYNPARTYFPKIIARD